MDHNNRKELNENHQDVPAEIFSDVFKAQLDEVLSSANINHIEVEVKSANMLCTGSDPERIVIQIPITLIRNKKKSKSSIVLKEWVSNNYTAQIMQQGNIPIEVLLTQEIHMFNRYSNPHVYNPYIGAFKSKYFSDSKEKWWIVMHDYSESLSNSFRDRKQPDYIFKVLRQMAKLYTSWETTYAVKLIAQCPWLLQDKVKVERRLALSRFVFKKNLSFDQSAQLKQEMVYSRSNVRLNRLETFLNKLNSEDLKIWEYYLCNRETIINHLNLLPQVFVHGDLYSKNIGIDCSTHNESIKLIDWEWVGYGNPALDIKHFLVWAVEHDGIDSEKYYSYFFKIYKHNSGLMSANDWLSSIRLATLVEGLIMHPFLAGDWLWKDDKKKNIYMEKTKYLTNQFKIFDMYGALK